MGLFNQENFSIPKITFIAVLFVQLVAMLWMSQDVGISADESRHIRQAEKVYNYYKSDGEDKSALEKTGLDPMQYNGQAFDNLMYLITEKFDVKNYIEMRHFFIALIGWFIILITGLIVKKSWGFEGAIVAILLLFISPRFIGHALNNNKDIPFALGFTLSIYGMIGFFRNLPHLKLWNIVWITLGIGMAISIRLAGILSISFLGLYSAVYYLGQKPYFRPFEQEKLKTVKKLVFVVPVIVIVGSALGIAYWPFMWVDPINHMKEILEATSSHPVSLNQLFAGEIIMSSKIPSDYVLTYVIKTYPVVILVGIILALSIFPFKLKKEKRFDFFIISFSFAFVMIWMSVRTSNYYGGIRHLLFAYPLAIALAVSGYLLARDILLRTQNKWLKMAPLVLVVILSIGPVIHLTKNYPYSYVYFNELAGGVKKAGYKYETDYFQHSLRHATEWFTDNELPKATNDTNIIKIITNDNFNTSYYLRQYEDKVKCDYTRYYEKSKADWDYGIFYCGYIAPNQISDGQWPPKGTIHTETVDGFPIAAVVKRISHEDYKGFEALKRRRLDEAKTHFRNFLKVYPENEEVLEGFSRAFLTERQIDSALYYADKSLEYNPRQLGALLLKASAHNTKKQYREAANAADEIIAMKEDFTEGHYQKGYALKNLNKPNDALKEFQKAVAYNNDYYAAYYQMGEILSNYKNYPKAIEVYSKVLEKKPDDFFAKINIARNEYLSGNKTKAEEILSSIPSNLQNRLEVVALRCRIAIDVNDLNTAARYLNMSRNINNNSDLYVLRGRFLLAQNNRNSAEENLKKAVELDPTNREAQEISKSLQASVQPTKQNAAEQPSQQQSIMFQKPEEKKASPITIPGR